MTSMGVSLLTTSFCCLLRVAMQVRIGVTGISTSFEVNYRRFTDDGNERSNVKSVLKKVGKCNWSQTIILLIMR